MRMRAWSMNPRAIFGLSILLGLTSSALVAVLLVWPLLHMLDSRTALLWLVMPHLFLRFIGLSFLVPGVVAASLSKRWAVPAAYGDFIAGILAIVATIGLAERAGWAEFAVWVFNIVGAGDLLFAFFMGARVRLEPGSLGASYFIVTAIVPLLLASHALIFVVLLWF